MRKSLGRRMVFGYIVIALFMLAMNFYLIFRLHQFNMVSNSFMVIDIPSLKKSEKLMDTLLEQVGIEKKYIVTGDKAFLNLFNNKKDEFFNNLKSLENILFDRKNYTFIDQIKTSYNTYLALVSREFILADYNKIVPPVANYAEGRKKTLEQLTGTINKLILSLQTSLIGKMEIFQNTVHKSTKISIGIFLFAIISGAIFSYFFIRSICSPIKTLTEATDRIASGDLDYRIKITSRDEIGTLGIAFNKMCERLKELDQLKLEFISNISHNFKTPLTAIREASSIMLDKIAGQVSDPQIRLLTIIKENTHRLGMMINDLLDISRLEAGLIRYNFQNTNIHDVIKKSIEEIRFLAESKKISILYGGKNDLPEIPLDKDKILQVMENLFSNAIKFTPQGGVISVAAKEINGSHTLRASVEHNRLNNVHSFIQVSISDTGTGIPLEYHQKVFDKFQQVVNKGKGGIKGTGLGLFIAKHIILDHGGDIWVENNSHKGCTFHFVLPSKYDSMLNS